MTIGKAVVRPTKLARETQRIRYGSRAGVWEMAEDSGTNLVRVVESLAEATASEAALEGCSISMFLSYENPISDDIQIIILSK